MIIDIWWSPKYHILSNKCTRAESIGGQISKEGGAYFKLRIVVHMKFCIYSRTAIAILIVLLFEYFFNIHFYLVTCRLWLYFYSITHFNTYVPNAPFLYPLKTSENRWWGSLAMVPAGNKTKLLSSVNHTTKTIHHHYLHHHHH